MKPFPFLPLYCYIVLFALSMLKYKNKLEQCWYLEVILKQPLVEAMQRYLEEDVYPLHTPGHKGGRGMQEPLRSLLGEKALALDVSLMHELDDIHEPTGCIKEAQEAAAALYGSDACFFAVNGTTGALHGMLLAALEPGAKVLVPRNSHRSVIGGLLLADAVPVYLQPLRLSSLSLQGQVTVQQVEAAFREYPDLKAVLLTSPNYFGMAADIKGIAAVTHKHNALLLVDEAHGPHLGFHEAFPPSALVCGADFAAQSTHKILGAMTQCSWLHVRGDRARVQRAADAMSLLSTTSPNYLLLGSLDAARAQLAAQSSALLEDVLRAASLLRQELAKIPGLQVICPSDVTGKAGVVALDPGKVAVNVKGLGISGIQAGELLRRAKLAVELVDPQYVLFLVTYADWDAVRWPQVVRRIGDVFRKLGEPADLSMNRMQQGAADNVAAPAVVVTDEILAQAAVPLRRVFYSKKKMVPLAQAEGEVSAESISFYPPGIPLILPGERFTKSLIEKFARGKEQGLTISGAADATLQTVRVLA